MSSASAGGRRLIAHVLFARKMAALYQLLMLFALAVIIAVFYRAYEARHTADWFAGLLGPAGGPTAAARPHLFSLAGDVRRLLLENIWSQSLVLLGTLTLALLAANVFQLIFSLTVQGALIPRNEWGAKYLAREKAADRKIIAVVALGIAAYAAVGGWWLHRWVFEVGSPKPALVVPTTGLITVISLGLAAEYLVQSRWGFLSYLRSGDIGDGDFVRLLAARLLTALSFVLLLLLAVFALRHVLAPRLIENSRGEDAALERRLESFEASAAGAGVGRAEIEEVAGNVNLLRRELRAGVGRIAGALDDFENRQLRIVGYMAAGLFLVMFCFPISYREVRWVPLVYVLIAVLLLWADLALREGVSRLFRLDAPAPWPLLTALLFVLMGDAMSDLIKMAFRRRARCASCGKWNAQRSRYCSECGQRLRAAPAEKKPAGGDERGGEVRPSARTSGQPPKRWGVGLAAGGLLIFLAGVLVAGAAGRRGRGARRRGRVRRV